jgi:hypothetical protein
VSFTILSPAAAFTPLTSSGGVRSTMGGGGCGVPGGGGGFTVSTAEAVVLLPLASVAVNVIFVAPTGSVAGTSVVIFGAGSTMSFATAVARNAWTAVAELGMPASLVAYTKLSGGTRRCGGVVSRTDTVKAPEAVFPCESVAVQVTFVAPSGNSAPEAGEHVTGSGPSMSSTAVGATYETRDPSGPFASREKLAGSPVRTGAVVSTRRTVTANDFDAVFEWASVAVHVTVVAPTGNVVPEAGLQLGLIDPSTLSLALAE